MNLFEGYSPEHLALIDQLRQAARKQAAVEQAADAAAESVRRRQALGFWRRFYIDCVTRFWFTVASALFGLSKLFPWLERAAISAGRRGLQPPSLYPDLRASPADQSRTVEDESIRTAAAYRALAVGIKQLPAIPSGRLSVEHSLQVEELARRIDQGSADETHVRDAVKRIGEGESLVETLKRA